MKETANEYPENIHVLKKREAQERRNKLKKCKAMKHPNEVNHT